MSRASTHTAYSTLFFLATLLLGAPLLPLPPTLARDRADLAAIRRLLRDERPSTRAAALRRLAGREDRPALDLVVAGLEDPHPYVRRAAAGVLGALDGEGIRPRLARRLRGAPHALVRQEACRTFALWADDGGGRALLESALDGDPGVRAEAVRWLSEVPGEESARALAVRLAHDPDGGVRALALDALAARPEAGPPLLPHLGDADERVRFSALEGSVARASSAGDADAAAVAVLRGLDDAVWSVRLRAAELAGGVKDRRLLPALVRRLEDPRQCVADAAHEALVRLTHIPFDPVPRVWLRWLAGDGASFDPAVADDAPSGRPRAPARPDEETVEAARFMGLPIRSRHVAFVLDASGSMDHRLPDGRTRWTGAVDELRRALDGLAGAGPALVNVYRFQDAVEAAFPVAVDLSPSRRHRLDEWLDRVTPAGRTALYDGVAAALADPDLDTVVVLSDGAPSAGRFFTKTDLLEELRRRNRWRHARIDVLSVGADGVAARWRSTLETLARESGGAYLAL